MMDVLLSLLLGATVAEAETPGMAVIAAAAAESQSRVHQLRITEGAFNRLPKPGPGMVFSARSLGSDAGWFRVDVKAQLHGELVGRAKLSFSWAGPVEVLVALRAIAKGAEIGPDDISIEPYEGGMPTLFLTARADAVGKIARYAIAPGTMLQKNAVRPRRLVRRGDRIRVYARTGGLVVTLDGTAVSGGGHGEPIRVRNARSSRIIEAVVSGPGEAEVGR